MGDLDAQVVLKFRNNLLRAGVGKSSISKTMAMLQRAFRENNNKNSDPRDEPIEGLGWMGAGVAGIALVAWTIPVVAGLLRHGRAPHIGPVGALVALLRLLSGGHWSDPASAYPAAVRSALPGPLLWWTSTALVLATLGGNHHLHHAAHRTRDRPRAPRPSAIEWRGARPRTWARHRDLRAPRSAPRGFSLGRLDGRPIYADEEAHVVVIAPTRAGKTTRCVIP